MDISSMKTARAASIPSMWLTRVGVREYPEVPIRVLGMCPVCNAIPLLTAMIFGTPNM